MTGWDTLPPPSSPDRREASAQPKTLSQRHSARGLNPNSKTKIHNNMATKTAEKKQTTTSIGSGTSDTEVVNDAPKNEVVAQDPGFNPIPQQQQQGAVDASDIVFPELKVMHKTTKLVEDGRFRFMDFVFDREIKVSGQGLKVNLTVLAWSKYYEENIPWGDDRDERVFQTLEEVEEAGGWVDWRAVEEGGKKVKPPFGPKMTAVVLIKLPDHSDIGDGVEPDDAPDPEMLFPFEYEGEGEDDPDAGSYAIGLYHMKGTAYTNGAKHIITASATPNVGGKIHRVGWTLSSTKRTFGENTIAVPVLKRSKIHSDAFAEWALSQHG